MKNEQRPRSSFGTLRGEQVGNVYSGRIRSFDISHRKIYREFGAAKRPKSRLSGTIIKGGLTVFISVLVIFSIAKAGNLTPSALPGATMRSLQELWNVLAGDNDASSVTPNPSGNIQQQLKFITQNLGGYDYGSANADEVLTSAGGSYNAVNLTPANVRSGVAFATSSIGTYGGEGGWAYGSDDISRVLTTADAPGTFDASNLSVGTVKSGTAFGDGLTGAYPSADYPLSGDTGVEDAAAGDICSGREAWTKAGELLTGSLTTNAAYISVGSTYCGHAGTLFANLFNGTSGIYTGGSQAYGGADDYNNGGSPASGRYVKGWTACDSDNDYCGTGDSGADAKDNSTGLVWSMPCNGSGCAEFSDASPLTYTWDGSGANNSSSTASQLCSKHSGWYLPHQKQLMQAYIDGSYGNLESQGVNRNHWSATTVSSNTTNAWLTTLSNGLTYNGAKTNANYVRCVRPAN